ncbi:hypothetical protein V6N11_018954 [Hibiscus sabdariffa]|uniref:Uncharacterized protein n=1 Tax=Hibiscus sabdariffa TaxID=183260 RepID=A0ABR2R163_9ROSI
MTQFLHSGNKESREGKKETLQLISPAHVDHEPTIGLPRAHLSPTASSSLPRCYQMVPSRPHSSSGAIG